MTRARKFLTNKLDPELICLSAMRSSCILHRAIENIHTHFGVEFHDYQHDGRAVLITSGFGLGAALMDVLTDCRYFVDIDNYRKQAIDWEAVAVRLSLGRPAKIVLAGWFTRDDSTAFDNIIKSIVNVPKLIYIGNESDSLQSFIKRCNKIA